MRYFVSASSRISFRASGGRTSGESYYHYYKAHAGSGAQAGTLAQARALGKKLCPTCSKAKTVGITPSNASSIAKGIAAAKAVNNGIAINGAPSYSKAISSTNKYSAPGNTKVYVDLNGAQYFYYHKSSSCSKTGMKKGTKITLQYAKDWGYKACPFCEPPTSVE